MNLVFARRAAMGDIDRSLVVWLMTGAMADVRENHTVYPVQIEKGGAHDSLRCGKPGRIVNLRLEFKPTP